MHVLTMFLVMLIAGCSAMPIQGPTVGEISGGPARGSDYVLVKLAPAVLQKLDAAPPPSFVATFGDALPAPVQTIERGDVLSLTIWDTGGGLFSPQGAGQIGTQITPIPNQVVDPAGHITVPFVGQIRVAGGSTAEAQRKIVDGLTNQAERPQALVTIVTDRSNLITVVGDVKTPGELPLDVNGTRVLGAIARAGGSVAPAFDTIVQLTRKGVSKRLRMSSVLSHPAENIYLRPGDVVYVLTDPQFVAVLGAMKSNARIKFDAERMTLAEVLGESGGLIDQQAEPTGVFVFRVEPAPLANALAGPGTVVPQDAAVPVIFQADLRAPQDLFLAQSFQVHDRDIIYVANAEAVQLDKLLKIMLHGAEFFGIVVNRTGVSSGE